MERELRLKVLCWGTFVARYLSTCPLDVSQWTMDVPLNDNWRTFKRERQRLHRGSCIRRWGCGLFDGHISAVGALSDWRGERASGFERRRKNMALLLSSSVAGKNEGREEREGWVDGGDKHRHTDFSWRERKNRWTAVGEESVSSISAFSQTT